MAESYPNDEAVLEETGLFQVVIYRTRFYRGRRKAKGVLAISGVGRNTESGNPQHDPEFRPLFKIMML